MSRDTSVSVASQPWFDSRHG